MKLPIYKLPEKSKGKDFFYNMFGSSVNAAVSVVLLVVVSHLLDKDAAGIFTLAYSTAQMMSSVGTFEMRNIQVTDAKHEFGFSSVLGFRLITVVLMWAATAGFILLRGYSGEKAFIIAAVGVYMSFLALSDVFQGNLHFNGYLQTAGRSLGYVVIIATAVFSAVLALTHSLPIAVTSMTAVPLIWILLYDIPYSRNFNGVKPEFRLSAFKTIFICALPLFLSQFLNQYIFNAPKYAIDSIMTAADQANYGYLVMPAFVINLLSIFAFRPQLVTLSEHWTNGDFKKFTRISARLFLWIAGITVAALAGGYFLGIPVLNLLYGAHLNDLRGVFMILLCGGCFSACSTLTLTLFTTMRKQKVCLIAYGVTSVYAYIVPKILVSANGMTGAALSFLSETALLFVCMAIPFIITLSTARRRAAAE